MGKRPWQNSTNHNHKMQGNILYLISNFVQYNLKLTFYFHTPFIDSKWQSYMH